MFTYTGRIGIVLTVNCFMNVDVYTEYIHLGDRKLLFLKIK